MSRISGIGRDRAVEILWRDFVTRLRFLDRFSRVLSMFGADQKAGNEKAFRANKFARNALVIADDKCGPTPVVLTCQLIARRVPSTEILCSSQNTGILQAIRKFESLRLNSLGGSVCCN